LVTVATSCAVPRRIVSEQPSAVRTLVLERCPKHLDDAGHLAAVSVRLVNAARAGARVVWIRNTVREAQRAFRAVSTHGPDVSRLLFHARFRACDRRLIEQRVLDQFGKQAPSGGRVLIATQVVEQSLDLDFDELHTDLAPIDLLFQRAGRLHRHERVRLPGFELPRIVVHGPSDADVSSLRFGPSSFVYDVGTLWLSERALRSRTELRLPADIRPLVEEAYHPASRAALLPEGGAALVAAEERRACELEARRTNAKRCCIPPTTAVPDGVSALDDDEDAAQAFTRDGKSATLLPVHWDGVAGRGLESEPTSPAWQLDAERNDAWSLAGDLMDQTLSLPARTGIEGIPPSRDVAAWTAWRKTFERFAAESGLGARVVPVPMTRDVDRHKGWLRMGGKRRRVAYTPTLGLVMPSEKDEEEAR
jgi:hypothetical protein